MKQNAFTLVLGGGGAKGVYQIGVWQALRELRIGINAVIGTSIGAINGALILQGDFNRAYRMWMTMEFTDVLNVPKHLVKNGKFVLSGGEWEDYSQLRRSIFKNKGVDTFPMRCMLARYIDAEKVFRSKLDFGVVSYGVNRLEPLQIFREEMQPGDLYDCLMASSALPGLKPVKLKDTVAVDGGLYDNVPFSVARGRGYRRLLVVDVSGVGRNRRPDVEGTDTVYIKNSADLGSIMEIDHHLFLRNIEMGYRDTMKIFGKYCGCVYTYVDDARIKQKMLEYFLQNETELLSLVIPESTDVSIRHFLPEEFRYQRDFIGALAECAAISLKIDANRLYTFREFIAEIKRRFWENDALREKIRERTIIQLILEAVQKTKKVFQLSAMEYDTVISYLLNNQTNHNSALSGGILQVFLKEIYGARLFLLLLERMGMLDKK